MNQAIHLIKEAENKAEQIIKDAIEASRRTITETQKDIEKKYFQMIIDAENERKLIIEEAHIKGKEIQNAINTDDKNICNSLVDSASSQIDRAAQLIFERLTK